MIVRLVIPFPLGQTPEPTPTVFKVPYYFDPLRKLSSARRRSARRHNDINYSRDDSRAT